MRLSNVEEIERAIDALAPRELDELYSWLDRRYSQMLDDRIRTDLAAGKLDGAIQRALDDEKAGRTRTF